MELLQLLVEQGEQLEKTQEALHAAEERARQQERVARLAEDAVSKLAGVLEAAQIAQTQYTDKLRELKVQMGLKTETSVQHETAAEVLEAVSHVSAPKAEDVVNIEMAPTPAQVQADAAPAPIQENADAAPVAVPDLAASLPTIEPVQQASPVATVELEQEEIDIDFDAEEFIRNNLGITTEEFLEMTEDYATDNASGDTVPFTPVPNNGNVANNSGSQSASDGYGSTNPFSPFSNQQGVVAL